MAPDPRCSALSNAMKAKGKSYADIAKAINQSEQHVIDICTGSKRPTDAEFNALASALGITNVPHEGVHATA
ncbi:hypothetical protein K435DRAFT_967057 [Dendrothele bispora CBS 962.96]|uniref:HTH cro/C1-type domain-containing protein n=1 Tax=Dendrothele bispora (strain CBS 962.96) TaxID=1314807 RepID=A0A4S8L2S1_DENBC|nr:hypothetical protein K435DRAFT_872459 [Dendrothele bispora CBS 962.96]THU93918.1 hypothetical protein K435DRAFT_967057 [Dendrothele bispora CBS 962.96]